MKRMPSVLAAALICAAAAACKSTGTGTADLKKADIPGLKICYGDRRFLSDDVDGFDFNAQAAGFANAYWSSVASAVVYSDSRVNKSMLTDWGGKSLRQFRFYGEPANSGGTEGFVAEFDRGVLVAMRGTAGLQDVLTDLNLTRFRGKAFNRSGTLEELKIHKGFWVASGAVWETLLDDVLHSAPVVDLPESSEEAFRQANIVLRSIIQEADIESWNPNEHFAPQLDLLRKNGTLKKDANMTTLLGVLNIWAEEAMLASRAYVDGVKNGDMKAYDAVVAKGMARKKKNFPRIHPYFNFRAYKPVWLTGHSLGGAVSTVFAYRLLKAGVPVKGLITFGSPRVGNDIFEYFVESALQEDGADLNLQRYQNNNDGVTRIPHFTGFRHVGDPWYISADAKLFVREPVTQPGDLLRNSLARYVGNSVLNWYQDELPPGYRGIWTFDLKQFVNDHSVFQYYVPYLEAFAFGGKANGCS
jgi:hypothetical protein